MNLAELKREREYDNDQYYSDTCTNTSVYFHYRSVDFLQSENVSYRYFNTLKGHKISEVWKLCLHFALFLYVIKGLGDWRKMLAITESISD